MGCDICIYTEAQKLHGAWYCCDYFKEDRLSDLNDDGSKYEQVPIFSDRDYDLFSVLANVRNYAKTPYISEPRGLPPDATEIVRKAASDPYAYSHSWFTANELFTYQNKHPYTKCSGLLSPEQCVLLDKYGLPPQEYCQGTSRDDYQRRTWVRASSPLTRLNDAVKKKMCEEFYLYGNRNDLEIAKKLYYIGDKFRIVFWFE